MDLLANLLCRDYHFRFELAEEPADAFYCYAVRYDCDIDVRKRFERLNVCGRKYYEAQLFGFQKVREGFRAADLDALYFVFACAFYGEPCLRRFRIVTRHAQEDVGLATVLFGARALGHKGDAACLQFEAPVGSCGDYHGVSMAGF